MQGELFVCGGQAHDNNQSVAQAVIRRGYARAGIAIETLPEGVILDWRDGFWMGVNYGDKPYPVAVPANAKILVGSRVLPPAGVVWKE